MRTNRDEPSRPDEDNHSQPPALLTIPQAARRLAIGRSTAYLLIGAGELEVVHLGRAVRVPADAVDDFIARRRAAGNNRAGARQARPD
jgi:excisionase family DNA binding protein